MGNKWKYDSKEIFCSALSVLLQKKDFEDVSVADIVSESGLSKSTFYRCFKDKYDLATWRFTSLLGLLNKREFSSHETSSVCIEDIVSFINEDKAFFKKLIKYVGPNSLTDCYRKTSLELAEDICRSKGRELILSEKYTIYYHASAFMGIIQEWLLSNDSIDAKTLTDIINANRSSLLKDIYTN